MKVGARIKQRRIELGLSVDELATLLGKNRATIYRYENNEIEHLPITVLEPLAIALQTSPAHLMGWDDMQYDSKPKEDIHVVKEDLISYKPIQRGKTIPIPLIGRIPAGIPIEAYENIEGYVEAPESEVSNGNYFYLRVTGDSMTGSRICDGDLVLIRRQSDVENGEIAVVRINSHDATLKRVKKINGTIILYPDNPKYDPILINEDGAEIIGKVVKVEFAP